MQRTAAPLEGVRAVGRLEANGPWVGFGYRAGAPRFVLGATDWLRDEPADQDLILALAIAYFAGAVADAPPDLEAIQSDLSGIVRHLIGAEADAARRALLGEAMDAIDDGLAGDAVAGKLEAARTDRADAIDPVEVLVMKARQIAVGG